MKKLFIFLFILCAVSASAQIKISQFPTWSGYCDTCYVPILKNGTNYKIRGNLLHTAVDSMYQTGSTINYRIGGVWKTLSVTSGAGGVWGSITGSIASQTDLVSLLNGKEPTIPTGNTFQYIRGNKTLGHFDSSVYFYGDPRYLRIDDTTFHPLDSTFWATRERLYKVVDSIGGTTGYIFTNGLTYNSINKQVSALYASPIWDANRIQTYYVEETPCDGCTMVFNSATGHIEWREAGTGGSGGVVIGDTSYQHVVWFDPAYFRNLNGGAYARDMDSISFSIALTNYLNSRASQSALDDTAADIRASFPSYSAGYGLNLSSNSFSVDSSLIAYKNWVNSHFLGANSGGEYVISPANGNTSDSGSYDFQIFTRSNHGIYFQLNSSTFTIEQVGYTGVAAQPSVRAFSPYGSLNTTFFNNNTWNTSNPALSGQPYSGTANGSIAFVTTGAPVVTPGIKTQGWVYERSTANPDAAWLQFDDGKTPIVVDDSGNVKIPGTLTVGGTVIGSSGGSGVSSISLATPNVIFGTPVNFTNTSGAWSGTMALNSQSAYTVFGNLTGSAATPTFGKLPVQAINATGYVGSGAKALLDNGTWGTIASGTPTVLRSAATTLTLTTYDYYTFSGTSAATWTAPAISGGKVVFHVKNAGTALLTIQRAGTDQFFYTSATTSINISPGGAYDFVNDGTIWSIQ